MPDYSKSKIYKLTSSNTNDIYIGSTVLNLSRRKAHHVSHYKNYLLNKQHYITSFKIIECGGDIDICLLEEYPCNNKEQLHQRERFYIENNICVNKSIPARKRGEYTILNKEKFKEYKKEYKELNKEKIKLKDKEYRDLNKEIIKLKNKEYRELNKDKIKEQKKEYCELNKDKIIELGIRYRELNKDKIIERGRRYYELNKEKINERLRQQYRIKIEQQNKTTCG